MSNTEYKITITQSGDKIRHRVAAVAVGEENSVLVDMVGFMWCPELPGGGVDAGESTITAAMRELREESGWVATDPTEISIPGDWTYRIKDANWLETHNWNHEENLAVLCKAVMFKPDELFGSEGDALKCKLVPIPEVIDSIRKKTMHGMEERFRIKNMFILGILERLNADYSRIPKWTKW